MNKKMQIGRGQPLVIFSARDTATQLFGTSRSSFTLASCSPGSKRVNRFHRPFMIQWQVSVYRYTSPSASFLLFAEAIPIPSLTPFRSNPLCIQSFVRVLCLPTVCRIALAQSFDSNSLSPTHAVPDCCCS